MGFTSPEVGGRMPKHIIDTRQVDLVIPDGTKTITVNLPGLCNGQLVEIEYKCPSLTTDTTFNLELLTAEGSDMLGSLTDGLGHNKTDIVFITDTIKRFLTGNEKLKVVCASDQSGAKTITIQLKILSSGA